MVEFWEMPLNLTKCYFYMMCRMSVPLSFMFTPVVVTAEYVIVCQAITIF